ncbi:HAMP domain-containing sensor histidine kinase [Ideonella sp. A 288]|uniref:sensor histidine kinase n=1 Tax=Ideonella sp. A 288 TaxID=1962181 RepID=UPI000B4B9C17|nr:HAMP domain-containing sensor histidine kinase [Ideonella sp. A 288]
MRSLYLRIWLTVVLALAAFALASGWLWQQHLDQERARFEVSAGERIAAWAELVQRSMPSADAPADEQADALRDWSVRLRVPLALDDRQGQRVVASDSFLRRESDGGPPAMSVKLDDGRTLWIARRVPRRGPGMVGGAPPRDGGGPPGVMPAPMMPMLGFGLPSAVGPVLLMLLVFVAVAAGAYPVVRRLTSRLEALKKGVEVFGGGALGHRVDASGRDEVAAVASTFNRAADRIETLVRSHQSLLANASHELRSPLARLKMAVSMYPDATGAQRDSLRHEIETNVGELDALVEEVLLASRLDAAQALDTDEPVDLLVLAAEEAARVGAEAGGVALVVQGSERLLRRAMRNLLENARRYGQKDVEITVAREADGRAGWRVCDRGPGVPEAHRERIFEPFFRLPGHAEREGGVGLGLSLVRQIVERHGGQVQCQPRAGGGTCFVVSLPGDRVR